jgi:hypothetical protein
MGFFYAKKMSKDPAFLFYTSDFLTGTMTMTHDQVGKYIRLLCMQHQKGDLTEKDMLFICNTYDEDIYSKFDKIDGKFRNQRLFDEVEKRKNYSDSRRKNRQKKDNQEVKEIEEEKHMLNTSKTYDEHMENENENEDVNINIDDNLNKLILLGEKPKKDKTPKILMISGKEYSKDDLFEFAWKSYLRKQGKADAKNAWDKLTIAEIHEIGNHLPKYIKAHKYDDPKYIPHFSTYLNKKRFKDEIQSRNPLIDDLNRAIEEETKRIDHLQRNTLQLPENQ